MFQNVQYPFYQIVQITWW